MNLRTKTTQRKKCKTCEFVYEGKDAFHAFRPKHKKGASNYSHQLRATCLLCEQDRRTKRSKDNYWNVKAAQARRSHAKRFSISVRDLEERHGWNIGRIAHRFEHNFRNGCPECHNMYDEMEGGRGAITVDIWDPRLSPDYDANTRDMCKTCNGAKGNMTPKQWITRKRLWRERELFLGEQAREPELVQLGFLDSSLGQL